jgi:Family of unknown function (DUF6325)
LSAIESAAAPQELIGPVDVIVIGYAPDAPMKGDAVPLLMDLVDRGIIRVLDVMFVTKEADGTFAGFEAVGLTDQGVGDLRVFEGASSGLLGDDDVAQAADGIEAGTSAVLILYENRWAAPFAAAVRRNGGELIAHERIPVEDLLNALETAEAVD